MKNLFGVVEHMRQLNLRTVEHLEKQKLRNSALSTQLDHTQIQLSQYTDKCVSKDLLIRTIVDLAQSMVGTEFSVASLVRSLRETTIRPSFVRKSSIDFNLETLCQYLESSANELIRKKQDQEQVCKAIIHIQFVIGSLRYPFAFTARRRSHDINYIFKQNQPNFNASAKL